MIYKKCIMTINKNNATLDEDIYLFRLDKNIELHFSIVNNRYKFDKSDLNNIIAQTNAAYFQIRLYRSDEIKYTFAIQPTQDGVAVLTITDDLINDPIEVGEYDFQISLLDADKTSMISMPIVTKQLHVCEPLVSDTALMGKAVLGLSTAANGEMKNAFDSEGNYIREIHSNGEIISAQLFNKFEEALETNTKAIKAGTGGGGTGGTYDDTAIKADINAIKTELGTDTLTTTAQNIKGAINEVNKKIGTGTGTAPTVTSVEPVDGDIPRVFFNGEKPTSKTAVHATIEYKSKTEHFRGYVEIKCQGTSSMSYPKKNYTIKMFKDSTMAKKVKKDFKGWGEQSKFCLKANYIDHSHARNICAAKLWNQIVASRANYALLPELLRTSPCNGAIDGFPIKVYYNNNYEGVYTWNIPKDKWMFNMDDTLDNHCVLCGEEYKSGCFLTANASLWSDEIHDTMPASIVTSFNAFQNFVITSTDEQFKANLENYVYVDSLIDYYIFQYVICGLDSMGKNQLFATYDGTKWIATSYDMDSTFGIYWNGQKFVAPTYRMQDDYESVKNGAANKLYVRLEKLFVNEIKARYSQLRADILSYNNIVNTFEPFMDTIGNDLYAEDLTIYSGIPSGSTNNIQQIRNYYRDRVTYVDAQINKLVSAIACTNITLNNTTLSFTTDAAQTLTATVTPTDTTDKVVWSVNPSGICSVNNGVVTPIKNGNCVITATCGTKSATCSVTVSGISTPPSSVLYTLPQETTFNGSSDYVDTGVQLFKTDRDFTITMDVTADTSTTIQNCIMHCMKEQSPYPGIVLQISGDDGYYSLSAGNNVSPIRNLVPISRRTKLVIVKNGTTMKVYNNNVTDESQYRFTAIDQTLLLGAYQTTEGTKGRFFKGTIHEFSIIDTVYTNEQIKDYLAIVSKGERVFKIDSTCMNTESNKLTDSIGGIEATLVGAPTVSNNQIVFTENDSFNFDLSSLILTNKDRTFRIKFTPTSLDTKSRCIYGIGVVSTQWSNITSGYIKSDSLLMQHGNKGMSNSTVGINSGGATDNRLPEAPAINTEYEIVVTEQSFTNKLRWFVNGTLVQDGTTTLYSPLSLGNNENINRFIGSYSLIEIYDRFCDTYEDFNNIKDN